jgi:tetratricopeptide (TPR) repeat protein
MARAHLGQENSAVADALGQLGWALNFLDSMDEAEKAARQAIAMQRKVRGNGSPEEAWSLQNLANIMCNQWDANGDDQAKVVEAEESARASVAIYRNRLGNECDDTAWALHTLAIAIWEQHKEGKTAEAEALMREVLAIRRRIHGDEHPFTASDRKLLGKILFSLHRLDEAEDCFRKALATMEKLEGKGKLVQADTHASLADVYRAQGKLTEAETEFREAIATETRAVGPDYRDIPRYRTGLARTLTMDNKLDEAREQAEEAIAICNRHPHEMWPGYKNKAEVALREITTKIDQQKQAGVAK